MATIFTKTVHEYNMEQVVLLFTLDLNHHYVVASGYTPWSNEPLPDAEVYSDQDLIEVKREMIFGKKIKGTDIAIVFRRRYWEANTVYDMYDHRIDLRDKDYFVINSTGQVYKCLYNNKGAISTTEPTTISNLPFETVDDGYIWKYMFTITSAAENRWGTSTYAPIVNDSNVVNSAIDGAIHVTLVEDAGTDYVSTSGIIQQVVSSTVFRIESDASSANGFYSNSSIYISSGTGSGNVAVISDYHINASGKFITTANALSLDLTSNYVIGPQVKIIGNGTGATAYVSSINEITGAIEKIEMVNVGSGYHWANVEIEAFSGSGATATAIIAPLDGHGAHPPSELLSEIINFAVRFEEDEAPTGVTFRRVALISNPLVNDETPALYTANTFLAVHTFAFSATTGTFNIGETVRGSISNATGTVAFANSTHAYVGSVAGTFANNDILVGDTTGYSGIVDTINTPDVLPMSGDIFMYSHVEPVTRSVSKSESIKLLARY